MNIEFRLLGIPVRIHLWFWLMALALWTMQQAQGWAGLAIWTAVVLQGILMHELGHAIVGRAFGLTPRIELVALGGVTWWEQREPMSPGRRLIVSAAGPVVGIVIGSSALLYLQSIGAAEASLTHYVLSSLIWVNLGWGLLNLLPIMPLDGGNIVAALCDFVAPSRGRLIASYVSFGVIGLLLAFSIRFQQVPATILLVLLGFTTYQIYRVERQALATPPRSLGEQAFDALEQGDGRSLVSVASQLVSAATGTVELDEAFHLLAWGRLLDGEPSEAYAAIQSMSGTRRPDPALEGAILVEAGRASDALPLLEEACERGGSFAEGFYVKAIEELGAFSLAAQFLSKQDAPRLSGDAVRALQRRALSAQAFDAARELAALPVTQAIPGDSSV